jgi:Asp-tRNA(Asn)/Glu-tRNA(Gln) amidotransferase A subunit family amidase
MCYASIGTDTAGSIREPAALCGIVGLKPSYGAVSTRGVVPLSESLDHAGPLTRSVEDAATIFDALTGANSRSKLGEPIHQFTLGVSRKYFFEDLDSEVASAVELAVEKLAGRVKSVREVECPIDEDRTVFLAESRAYHRDKIETSAELYDPETLRRLNAGSPISEKEYREALKKLQETRQNARQMFRDVDIILTPATPIPAPRSSDLLRDISQLRPAELVLLRNTRPVNVWGLPAISIPCGITSEGLPIGLQIIGPPNGEEKVLRAAYAYEQRTP